MNCYYCDRIAVTDPGYSIQSAAYDLASQAPRCARHWRFHCGKCNEARHFMALSWCDQARKFYCSKCASNRAEVGGDFWCWQYHNTYQSPWSGEMRPALDRLEFESRHPLQLEGSRVAALEFLSKDTHIQRYPPPRRQWRENREFGDDEIRENWNANAEIWAAGYDDDGDRNRRQQSDEPMLALLGDVAGRRILDVGSGNGYLCRKLSKAGARMTGVEFSDAFFAMARNREEQENLGTVYHNASATQMPFLADQSFDKAVSNYVLMDIRDYQQAVREVHRVLKPGGHFVVVISHPAFASGHSWLVIAPDTPRQEERTAYMADLYFERGPYLGVWGNLKPVLSFHRPMRDYWETFSQAGFAVDGFDEPSISPRGLREVPPWRVRNFTRIAYSCIFRLRKSG